MLSPFDIRTALSLHELNIKCNELPKIPTGDKAIDEFLEGGFLISSMSEICGAAGTGKTQFAIQCSIATIIKGYSVVYLITNPVGGFSTKRLLEIIESQLKDSSNMNRKNVLDRMYISIVSDWNHLCNQIVQIELPMLLKSHEHIKLVVLDDIANLYRLISPSKALSCELFQLASKLSFLSISHHISIICINQVTDRIGNHVYHDRFWEHPAQSLWQQLPCMGISWSYCIQTRIFLKRSKSLIYKDIPQRKMYISKSSHLSTNIIEFVIDSDGIKGYQL